MALTFAVALPAAAVTTGAGSAEPAAPGGTTKPSETAAPAKGTDAKAADAKAADAKAADSKAATKQGKADDFENQKLDKDMFAEESASGDKAKQDKQDDGASAGTVGRMILGLLFVLGLIYAVHYMLKKYGKSRLGATGAAAGMSGAIDVIASTPLAAGRMLHLVRVGNQTVLLGATDSNITQLGTVDTLEMTYAAGNAGNTEFQQLLNGAIVGSPQGTAQRDTFLRRFVANLQMMTAR